VSFEGFTAVNMKIPDFHDITLSSLDVSPCFGGTCFLHLHDIRVSRVWKKSGADVGRGTARIGALREPIGEKRSVK
jgi:hypothetical protein